MNAFEDPKNSLLGEENGLTPESLLSGFRERISSAAKWPDKVADILTDRFGTVGFLLLNGIFFAGWIFWNNGYFGNDPFDPFPYSLLTMIVSLEAIFLATIVLITQNRQGKIADLRQQMDFEIDIRAEKKISKILKMLAELNPGEGSAKKDGPTK